MSVLRSGGPDVRGVRGCRDGQRFGAVKADVYELQATLDSLAQENAFAEIKGFVHSKFSNHDQRVYSSQWSPSKEGHRSVSFPFGVASHSLRRAACCS